MGVQVSQSYVVYYGIVDKGVPVDANLHIHLAIFRLVVDIGHVGDVIFFNHVQGVQFFNHEQIVQILDKSMTTLVKSFFLS